MKSPKNFIPRTLIAVFALLIAVCITVSVLFIESFAKADCFNQIEATTMQISDMFRHTLIQSEDQLMLFADVLATNSYSEEVLDDYMKNFSDTQSFNAVCLHRRDGTFVSYGDHPAHDGRIDSYEAEAARAPYISDVYSMGAMRSEKYVYIAVPVEKEEETLAILYGYISLDTFPSFISSTAYGGRCQFYIVDGNNGDFLMDEYHRYDTDGENEIPLSNVFDGSMAEREAKPGYHISDMREGLAQGRSGYHVFKSQRTGQWYYTYYMPTGINNWSLQMTIDEPTAFAAYHNVRTTVLVQVVCVSILTIGIITVMVWQNRRRRRVDAANLHRADYHNAVQSALITAHNNPDFVDRALRIIGKETGAETALLLTFSDRIITDAYYWPSSDRTQAMMIIGLNIRKTFPILFEALASNESIFCDEEMIATRVSEAARDIFASFDIRNMLLTPITDNSGLLRGAIAVVNITSTKGTSEMLECVSCDFFMAISNLENHNIIRKMGTIDYLTGIKNRNSFETDSARFETVEAETLWCIYVDVNGLHEMNNTKGHSAGDALLCTVAAMIKKVFGDEHSYRLGGDEFVAFRTDSSHEEFMSFKYRLLSDIAKKGYSVSVGFEVTRKNENGVFDVAKVMAEAEAIMYREKRKYYQENGISSER